VVELRAGECERRGLSLGDRVAWAARASTDEIPIGIEPVEGGLGERRGSVVLASRDQRYVKLVRFLLDGKGIDVVASVAPSEAADVAGGESADVVVIDAGDAVAEGLRLAHVTRVSRPEATVVLVGEGTGDRSPGSVRIYEKWDETEGVVAAVEDALSHKAV
jgi:PleD family two-component response regulator